MLRKCNHAFNCVDKTSMNVSKPEKQLMSAGDYLNISIDVFQFSPCIKHVNLVFWHVVSAI